ncbi:MAG: maleylacetoacetate isomerase [Proteobacteria bacterium]|nr:maleylacetoacetate isomerase [Pseudomonadota bacterium]
MYELHEFHLSVASYRVRIGLNLKGVEYQSVPVSLVKGGGEQHLPEYRALNVQGLVPTYADRDITLTQSIAILEYLDEQYPEPAFLPGDALKRARARQIAHIAACDIQPLLNLRVLAYLRTTLKVDQAARSKWFRHWMLEGLDALELLITAETGSSTYCLGNVVSLADIVLVPLVFQARRFKLAMDDFPRLCEIEEACLSLEAFRRAAPHD